MNAGRLAAIAMLLLSGMASAPRAAPEPDPGHVAALRSGEPGAAVAQALRPALPLRVPVDGVRHEQLVDSYADRRGGDRMHEAIDILAPRGTPVRAVAQGQVVKLFHSKPGGLTVYQFDPTRSVAYYYAHLDRYAEGLAEGQVLERGALLGYVGSTGNADPAAPHLHFAVFELDAQRQWWKGRPINPTTLFGPRSPADMAKASR